MHIKTRFISFSSKILLFVYVWYCKSQCAVILTVTIQSFHRTLWLMMVYHQTILVAKD